MYRRSISSYTQDNLSFTQEITSYFHDIRSTTRPISLKKNTNEAANKTAR